MVPYWLGKHRRQNRVNLTVDQKQFQEEEQKVRKRVRGKE